MDALLLPFALHTHILPSSKLKRKTQCCNKNAIHRKKKLLRSSIDLADGAKIPSMSKFTVRPPQKTRTYAIFSMFCSRKARLVIYVDIIVMHCSTLTCASEFNVKFL